MVTWIKVRLRFFELWASSTAARVDGGGKDGSGPYIGTAALRKRKGSVAAGHNRMQKTSWVASIFAVSSHAGGRRARKALRGCDAAEHEGAVVGGGTTEYAGPACRPALNFHTFFLPVTNLDTFVCVRF